MRIDEAGQDHLALEIDAAGVRSGEGQDLAARSDREHLVAIDGDGLGDGKPLVDRYDLAVMVDGVGKDHLAAAVLGKSLPAAKDQQNQKQHKALHADSFASRAGPKLLQWKNPRRLPGRRRA